MINIEMIIFASLKILISISFNKNCIESRKVSFLVEICLKLNHVLLKI